jgi:hypothetical protein
MRVWSFFTWVVGCGTFVALAGAMCFGLRIARAAGPVPVTLLPPRFEFEADPGERVGDVLTFWNRTDVALPIQIDAADFRPDGEDGKIAVGAGEDSVYSLRDWVQLSTVATTVGPGAKVSLPFSIAVPAGAVPGSRWGALRVSTEAVESDGSQAARDQISANVILRVRGEAPERVALGGFSAERVAASGTVVFAARFRNEGVVNEKPAGQIRVYSMLGSEVAAVALPAQNVLPGAVRKVRATLDSTLGFGRYRAELVASYGAGQSVFGTATFWVVSKGARWTLLVVLLVGVLGGAMLAWRHVRPSIILDHHAS